MATNPKLPDFPDIPPRKPRTEPLKIRTMRQSKFPWPLIVLLAGLAILAAIFAMLPRNPKVTRTPSAAQIPRQPTGSQVQFTNVALTPSPVGDAVYLDAVLHNAGSYDITGVEVNAKFLGANGTSLQSVNGAVQSVTDGTVVHNLVDRPIKPNESRPVRIYFEHTPKGWNHEVPALTVTTVTGTTPH